LIFSCASDSDEVSLPAPSTQFEVARLGNAPIIRPDMPGLEGRLGENINGPSLIKVPEWIGDPLGRYYLYFAHHRGEFIRIAYANELEGPWRIHEGGVLRMRDAPGADHIASPDVRIDDEAKQIRMYFHQERRGSDEQARHGRQVSFVALSEDGLRFEARDEVLGAFYFRVFEHGGYHYAFAKNGTVDGIVYRSRDGLTGFEAGPHYLPGVRHTALWTEGDTLHLLFTRVTDAPESILITTVDLGEDFRAWKTGRIELLLKPEMEWEGAGRPIEAAGHGPSRHPSNALRDPCIYQEGKRTYLLYAVQGERGIALAEIRRTDRPW
jgi:hypothetical protein